MGGLLRSFLTIFPPLSAHLLLFLARNPASACSLLLCFSARSLLLCFSARSQSLFGLQSIISNLFPNIHTIMQTIHFELRGDEEDFIQLIQLLKATNLVYNGAEAQEVVTAGMVLRNGVVETRKRAKIVRGDVIEYEGNRIEVI